MKGCPSICKGKSLAQQCIILALFSFGIIALACVVIVMLLPSNPFCKGKKDMEKTAIEALKIKVDNPSSLQVLAVSEPDSVFQNRYCSEAESMELSQRFLDYSIKMMNETPEDFGKMEDPRYMDKMQRFSEGSNTLSLLNSMAEREPGDFIGWRLRIRYAAKDINGNPYLSEIWMIFDRNKKHILKTLEIPSL